MDIVKQNTSFIPLTEINTHSHRRAWIGFFTSPIPIVLIWVICLLLIYTDERSDSIGLQHIMGMMVLGASLSCYVGKKTNAVFGIVFGYFLLSSLPKIGIPYIFWPEFDYWNLEARVTQAVLYLVSVILVFCTLAEDQLGKVKHMLFGFAFFDSIYLTFSWFAGLDLFFLMNAGSVDAAFIACSAPLVFSMLKKDLVPKLYYLVAGLYLLPLVLTKSSSGILGLGLLSVLYFRLWGTIACSVFGVIGYILQGQFLFNSSGRFGVWILTLRFWRDKLDMWTGAGLGTYREHGPALQYAQALKQKLPDFPAFPTMHNDWLQVLFESGWLGLLGVIVVYGMSLKMAKKDKSIFYGLILFGAMAVIQMPLRILLFSCLGAFLVRSAVSASKEVISPQSGHDHVESPQ